MAKCSVTGNKTEYSNPDDAETPYSYAEIQCQSEGGLRVTWFGWVSQPGGPNDNRQLEAEYAATYGPALDAFEQNWTLGNAVATAKQALTQKPCRDLFSANFDPGSVLDHLVAGDAAYGKFSWEAMGPDGSVAEVRGYQASQGAASGWTVNVVINASGNGGWFDLDGARAWYGGNYSRSVLNAETIIHELGHAFGNLFGANTTSILNDSQSRALGLWNSDLVMTSCFGWRGN